MAAGIQMPRPFMVSYHYRIVIHDTHPGVTSRINLAHFRRQMDCTLEQKPLLNAIGRVVDSIGNTNDEVGINEYFEFFYCKIYFNIFKFLSLIFTFIEKFIKPLRRIFNI